MFYKYFFKSKTNTNKKETKQNKNVSIILTNFCCRIIILTDIYSGYKETRVTVKVVLVFGERTTLTAAKLGHYANIGHCCNYMFERRALVNMMADRKK